MFHRYKKGLEEVCEVGKEDTGVRLSKRREEEERRKGGVRQGLERPFLVGRQRTT
jgi:hypothetical protein